MPYLKTAAYSEPEEPKSNQKFRFVLYFFAVVLITGVGLFCYSKRINLPKNNLYVRGSDDRKKEQNILQSIARHIALPTGEEPLVGTIEQPESLKKEQPFFQDIERGDVVVLYQQTGRAIIYRPSRDILVNVGFLVVSKNKQTSVVTAPEKPLSVAPSTVLSTATSVANVYIADPLKIEIRNGSRTVGLAARVGKLLSQEKTAYSVLSVAPASRKDYVGPALVVFAKISPARLADLQKKIGAYTTLQQLPQGENSSHADAVLIIGN